MVLSTSQTPWSKEWISAIDLNKLTPFPLQFANCERIERHHAVYLFDEVGCGKTISAGLMALHYLYNHPEQRVLVVTVNALVTTGQFERDWQEKLPFQMVGWKFDGQSISVINHHYRNLERAVGQPYGLIILDEAHLFLNQSTKRHQALRNLRAEKVIFLTATPTKYLYQSSMETYADLADLITGKSLDRGWINAISTQGKSEEDILCQTFSLNVSATRYFKDTVKALTVKSFKRIKARRLIPDIWLCSSYETQFAELSEYIQKTLASASRASHEPESRFVVFVRYVAEEAQRIGQALAAKGFCEYSGSPCGKHSYKIVTGNSGELKPFQTKSGTLPTVLIITYQLAEQGVNLPGYNHVVNVHIPASPSALEQRFGRIDRLDSDYDDIKMHFLLCENGYASSNSSNFSFAVYTYLVHLISYSLEERPCG